MPFKPVFNSLVTHCLSTPYNCWAFSHEINYKRVPVLILFLLETEQQGEIHLLLLKCHSFLLISQQWILYDTYCLPNDAQMLP